jgi:hypothetical protein
MVTALLDELEVVAEVALVESEDVPADVAYEVEAWVVLDSVPVVSLVVEGFRAKASPIRRATPSSAANTTGRSWFKAEKGEEGDISGVRIIVLLGRAAR